MDVQTGLVYVGIVVVSAVAIACISMFGTREKSYEEAIAEQRKLPDDLLLNKKDKNKEKKHKNKAGKKAKEKKEEKDEKEDKDEKVVEHVQFEDTPQILPPDPPIQDNNKGNKKKGKLEKIKPILINKDEPLVVVNELNSSQLPLAEANHFDVIHPKDDLELVRSQNGENLQQIPQADTIINKSPKETPTKSKKTNNKDRKKEENARDEKQDLNSHTNASSSIYKETIKEVKEQQKETPVKEVKEVVKEIVTQQLSSKEPKKTKKKNDILAQIDGDAINVELLMLCIQKAELSRSEIQILTNHLLNKQQDNPLEHSEWTEGRADPVIKLKKQLAEKEKALADEHEASIAFQNKLKELRAEFNSEKSRLSANVRQLEDSLNNKITETQTLHTRMQHILESHVAEKQGFARQIEQLQTKVAEDSSIIHKLQEDQGQTQGHLQQELMAQRKQMEMQFTQMRENENALKTQLTQKHVEVQDLQNQLQGTCESSSAEIDVLRQQVAIMQNQLMHSEGQLQHFKETNDRYQDAARKLEESACTNAELEHRLKNTLRHEQELQKQVNSQQAELNLMKSEANETSTLKAELCKVQAELIKMKSELSVSKTEVKSQVAEITILKTALSNKEDELKKSQEEFAAIQNDMQQSKLQIAYMETKLNSLQKELDVTRIELERADRNLKEAKTDVSKHQNETQKLQEALTNMQAELAKADAQLREPNETERLKALQTEIDRLKSDETKRDNLKLEIKNLQENKEKAHYELSILMRDRLREETKRPLLPPGSKELVPAERLLLERLTFKAGKNDKQIKSLEQQINTLEKDADKHLSSIKTLEEELEAQRAKNNELRVKNWKVIEALRDAESRSNIAQIMRDEQEEITQVLLERIFPDIKLTDSTHEEWLEAFEIKISDVLTELRQKHRDKTVSELETQNKSLQGMVSNYKQIIEDTEGMLSKLQKHVESEEIKWESQLQQKTKEVANLRAEITRQAIIMMENGIKPNIKDYLEPNCKSAQRVTTFGELNSKELVTLEQLQEEKTRLSQELEVECNKRATLDAEVTKLRSLVETSEASLACEKNLVTQLQQEVSQLKNEICGGCSSSEQSMLNGPPTTDSLQSEPSLASQALISTLESTLLTNAEFANCSVTKPVNLVSQSEQEIENSPLTTKYSSKSCHMTDYNRSQANWNPMIGQQHKKHKKKRKSTKKTMAKRRRFAGWFKKKITSKNKLR